MGIAEARETIRACRHCFMCRYRSPGFIATKLESLSPHGHGILLSEIDSGKRSWTAEIVDKFYQSPLGGECRQDCAYNWPEDEMTRHARAEIVDANLAPEAVRSISRAIIEAGTPFGARNGWLKEHDRVGAKTIDVLFLAGETVDHLQPGILHATAALFDSNKVRWASIADEGTGGTMLFDLGYVQEAKKAAARLAEQIASRAPASVVTGCPHTLRAIREFWPQWAVELPRGVECLHTSEYFLRLVSEPKPAESKGLGEQNVIYHDCADLGRKLRIYEPPRKIIACLTGRPPIEFPRSREQSPSSGAGSSLLLTHPELSLRIARKTLEEMPLPPAGMLVTGCQNCATSFQRALGQMKSKIEALDVVELLARVLLPRAR
jgi:Fe-S oxidoreductase